MVCFIDAVTQGKNMKNTEQACANVQVGPDKIVVYFKLDTGADTKVIPTQLFRSLGTQDGLEPWLRPLQLWRWKTHCKRQMQHEVPVQGLSFNAEIKRCWHLCTPSARIKRMPGFGIIKLILPVSTLSGYQRFQFWINSQMFSLEYNYFLMTTQSTSTMTQSLWSTHQGVSPLYSITMTNYKIWRSSRSLSKSPNQLPGSIQWKSHKQANWGCAWTQRI